MKNQESGHATAERHESAREVFGPDRDELPGGWKPHAHAPAAPEVPSRGTPGLHRIRITLHCISSLPRLPLRIDGFQHLHVRADL